MGKTFAGSHKTGSGKRNYHGNSDSGNLVNGSSNSGVGFREEKGRICDPRCVYVDSGREQGDLSGINGINKTKCETYSARHDDSYEVWCICRLLKPCQECKERKRTEREKTPTPDSNLKSSFEESRGSKSGSVTPTARDRIYVEHVTDIVREKLSKDINSRNIDGSLRFSENSRNGSIHGISSANGFETKEYKSDGADTTGLGIDLSELFEKLDELNEAHDANGLVNGELAPNIAETSPGTPNSSMDTASTCSFDHFDFDTSFCSLKSTGKLWVFIYLLNFLIHPFNCVCSPFVEDSV